MLRTSFSCFVVAAFVSTASAQEPKPIRLWLTPAKLPTPALRYQLLPDARVVKPGNAADVYRKMIELLAKKPLGQGATVLSEWSDLPLNQLPKDDVRKALAEYDDVYKLLDEAARCERCDWGLRDRLREKGIGTLLPEIQPMRQCAVLLSVRTRLEMADGHFDKAVVTLRNGLALAHNIGDAETLINFLVGVAIAAIMERQLDTFIAQPDAPNLYYALTDLPAPLFTMRKGLQGERISIEGAGTFPGLGDIATNLNAGSLPEKDLAMIGKALSLLSKEAGNLPPALDRIYLVWNIRNKHEIAKQALIDAGRPREKVEAMPHLQVAMLHALLEYEAALDELLVCQDRPYWVMAKQAAAVEKRYGKERWKSPTAAAIPLAPLVMPAIQKVGFARARNERKIALLRTIEALRHYAATHDGKLPRTLTAIWDIPIPLDPVTGKSFEYQLDGDLAKLRAPTPADQKPNAGNSVVYEMKITK